MITNDKDLYLQIATQIEKHLGLVGVTINYRFRFQEYARVKTVHGYLNCYGYMNGSAVDHHYNVVIYHKRNFADVVKTLAHELRHVWQDENNGIRQMFLTAGKQKGKATEKAKNDPAEVDARWYATQYDPKIETFTVGTKTVTRTRIGFSGKINQ